jgi:hypothetical protein
MNLEICIARIGYASAFLLVALSLSQHLIYFSMDCGSVICGIRGCGFLVRPNRSIHDEQTRQFLCGMSGAGSWHEKLLSEGLAFNWISGPPRSYCEPNNKSAFYNLSHLRDTVATWLEGFIEQVPEQPFCCNPMTVAVQYNAVTDSIKYRPCIDLSRHVNKFIADMTVKLDDLTVSQELIHPGDYMVALV